jgi:hypothetical protein
MILVGLVAITDAIHHIVAKTANIRKNCAIQDALLHYHLIRRWKRKDNPLVVRALGR